MLGLTFSAILVHKRAEGGDIKAVKQVFLKKKRNDEGDIGCQRVELWQ
jgi:hypothetical protein